MSGGGGRSPWPGLVAACRTARGAGRSGQHLLLALALAAALLLGPGAARAHQAGLSTGTFTAVPEGLELDLRLPAGEVRAAFPALAAVEAAGPLAAAALAAVQVSQSGEACPARAGPAAWEPPDGLRLAARFDCPRPGEPMQLRLGLLSRLPPGHVHLARVEAGGRTEERVADARRDGFEVAGGAAPLRQAAAFVLLGVEHIFTGWDHLAFLLGLLLAAGSLREVVRSLTAFTVAHALTLALAVLGVVRPPAGLVEPLIAASVVLVAVENLRDLWRPGRARRRWPLALSFGLVHGFGFAGALGQLHLSGGGLAVALASFNGGVELGQVAVAAALFPALRWLRHRPALAAPGLPAASLGVAAAGLFWLVERL